MEVVKSRKSTCAKLRAEAQIIGLISEFQVLLSRDQNTVGRALNVANTFWSPAFQRLKE